MAEYCLQCGNPMCMCQEIRRAERPHANDELLNNIVKNNQDLRQENNHLRMEIGRLKEMMTPKQWTGLTDQEITDLYLLAGIVPWTKHTYNNEKRATTPLVDDGMDGDGTCLRQFAQLIEAKLKDKNS